MKHKTTRLSMAVLVVVLAALINLPVSAVTQSDREDVNRKIEQTQNVLKNGKEKHNQLIQQVQAVNEEMAACQEEIRGLERQISEKQEEISQEEKALELKKEETGKQNHDLEIRLRTMYKNGDTGMMEVLLGSADISELISNIEIIQKIYTNDMAILNDLRIQYEVIEEQVEKLAGLKEQLEQQQDEQQRNEEDLSGKMKELQTLEIQVAEDNEALEAQLDELNKEAEKITEELQRKELIASTSSGSSYGGGSMLWPVPEFTRLSSKYGYRFHPILHVNKMHTGLDISASSGKQILASADGTVILSSVKGGYGNCVMIDHGGGIVTLYGHCSKLLVSSGQKVARGQNVALVGSTGLSTGPHCHFEVRVNGSTTDPMNYLDLTGINVS